ncbi:hypothetical protein DLAC_01188 [Tieghemostelium lacteum]|uniref:Uncharacterized protein n=1 Tax=Tieghemostelium lacteum TaxID=361077 RepID=A0A152A8A0_TIELA|nr:hypothetical protein DLAC_01188 [Tieghemostelium lacteum]|eukprot:KYR02355.1 hypothetical protein DLAC_01188 [Tieghemostelium lacteum]
MHIISLTKSPIVVYSCHSIDPSSYFLFAYDEDDNPIVDEGDLSRFSGLLNTKDVYFLVDSKDVTNKVAKTIIVSYPNPSIYKEFMKDRGTVKRYMPIWDKNELDVVRPLLYPYVKQEILDELWTKWGGIPRFVLEIANDNLKQHSIKRSILSVDFNLCAQSVFEEDPQATDSHNVFQIIPYERVGFEKYSMMKLHFSSKYVAQKVTQINQGFRMEQIISGLEKPYFLHSPIGGSFFESIVHTRLQKGGTFTRRNLQTGIEDSITIDKPISSSFIKSIISIELAPNGHYLIPSFSNPSVVDSLIKPNQLFQVTVSPTHPTLMQELSNIIEQLKNPHVVDLYFVVPKDQYSDFKQQNYLTNTNTFATELSKEVQAVTQYILEYLYNSYQSDVSNIRFKLYKFISLINRDCRDSIAPRFRYSLTILNESTLNALVSLTSKERGIIDYVSLSINPETLVQYQHSIDLIIPFVKNVNLAYSLEYMKYFTASESMTFIVKCLPENLPPIPSHLKSINVSGTQVDIDDIISRITKDCPSLESIEIKCFYDYYQISNTSCLINIQSVQFSYATINVTAIVDLIEHSKMTKLVLDRINIMDENISEDEPNNRLIPYDTVMGAVGQSTSLVEFSLLPLSGVTSVHLSTLVRCLNQTKTLKTLRLGTMNAHFDERHEIRNQTLEYFSLPCLQIDQFLHSNEIVTNFWDSPSYLKSLVLPETLKQFSTFDLTNHQNLTEITGHNNNETFNVLSQILSEQPPNLKNVMIMNARKFKVDSEKSNNLVDSIRNNSIIESFSSAFGLPKNLFLDLISLNHQSLKSLNISVNCPDMTLMSSILPILSNNNTLTHLSFDDNPNSPYKFISSLIPLLKFQTIESLECKISYLQHSDSKVTTEQWKQLYNDFQSTLLSNLNHLRHLSITPLPIELQKFQDLIFRYFLNKKC